MGRVALACRTDARADALRCTTPRYVCFQRDTPTLQTCSQLIILNFVQRWYAFIGTSVSQIQRESMRKCKRCITKTT